MEKKEVEIGSSVTVAGVTVIPVIEVSHSCWYKNRGISGFGIKRLTSVIVVSPSVRKTFRVTGEEISLGQLTQETPDIKEILEAI